MVQQDTGLTLAWCRQTRLLVEFPGSVSNMRYLFSSVYSAGAVSEA